jgi:hypothetical protein
MLWPGKDSKAKFRSEYPVFLETIAHIEKYGVLYSAKRNNIQGEMLLFLANPHDKELWSDNDVFIPVKIVFPADLAAQMALLGQGGMHDPLGFCIYCNQMKPYRHIYFQFIENNHPVNFSAQASDNQIPAGALFVMNGGKDSESADKVILEAQFAKKTVPLDGSMHYLDSLVAEENNKDGAESDEDCLGGPQQGSVADRGSVAPTISAAVPPKAAPRKRKLASDPGLNEQGVSRNDAALSPADARAKLAAENASRPTLSTPHPIMATLIGFLLEKGDVNAPSDHTGRGDLNCMCEICVIY